LEFGKGVASHAYERKNHWRKRKKRLKQVISDLGRRACVTRSGIRGRKCRAVKEFIRVSRKKKENGTGS